MAMMRDAGAAIRFTTHFGGYGIPAFAGTTVGCACARRRLAIGARASRSSPRRVHHHKCKRNAVILRGWRVIRRETWANERFHDWQRRSRLRRERGPVGEVFCHRLVMGIC
jgi:hypothetical protein